MKKLVSRYPVNAAGNDIDRKKLCELMSSAAYPRFFFDLIFCPLPLGVIADAARVSVDVLLDAAIGIDSLNPIEDYAVRAALGAIFFDPLCESTFYETEPCNYRFSAEDKAEHVAALETARSITAHPAWEIFAEYIDKPVADIPDEIVSAFGAWVDFCRVSKFMHPRTRHAPLKKRKVAPAA